MSRNWVPWSVLGAWLTAVVLVVPAGAEDFSLARCLVTGSGSNSGLSSAPQRIDVERHLACYEAQREHTVRRQAEEAAERERQRGAAEATRQQAEEDQAKETADETAKKSRARQAEEVERARQAEEVERARQAEEVEIARLTEVRQQAQRARRAAEQFMPGACPLPDLTAKCALPQDPVLEQIRKSQENAARGRPSR
jgi:hypothetical protein